MVADGKTCECGKYENDKFSETYLSVSPPDLHLTSPERTQSFFLNDFDVYNFGIDVCSARFMKPNSMKQIERQLLRCVRAQEDLEDNPSILFSTFGLENRNF